MITISLDHNWRCEYTSAQSDLPEFTHDAPINSLAAWRFDPRSTGQVAWLKRILELKVTDCCVNYVLHADLAPVGTRVYINQELVGTLPAAVDITMSVALGENEIVMRVETVTPYSFGSVELWPVPCD